MTARRRSRSPFPHRCLPHIACFHIAAQEEENEGEAEDRQKPLAKRSGRRWLSSQCRRLALDIALLLSSHSGETAPSCSSFLRRRRRTPPPKAGDLDHRSWLLKAADAEAREKAEEPHSSIRSSFGSQMDPDSAAVVLLLNLEMGKEAEDEEEAASSSSSPSSSSSQPRNERPVLIRGRRGRQCLERAISPVAGALVRFGFPEIRAATKGFCRGRVLGRGALSCVFRGRMRRLAVAVKRLEGPREECARAFCRELTIAGALRNANVVPLVGFCIDREGLFLVYKYVSGGSLDQHLYSTGEGKGSKGSPVLSWKGRFKVALGTARALEYLHFGTDKCIIHRDIKPSNILLSSDNAPKLCDFGLATWTHGPSLTFLCKNVKGTFGYLAPEYFQHGKLSDKTDVYAFGVLLLELISGRKAIDTTRPQGDENLVIWARQLLQQGETAVKDLIDPRLNPGSCNHVEVNRMLLAATACLDLNDSSRPTIKETIQILYGKEDNAGGCINLSGGCYLAAYGSQWEELNSECDIQSHLALAMFGVSDSDSEENGVL